MHQQINMHRCMTGSPDYDSGHLHNDAMSGFFALALYFTTKVY